MMRFAVVLFIFFTLFISLRVSGQSRWDCDPRRINYDDGQSIGYTWSICQDTTGILWMSGGVDPIKSSDGKTIEVYRTADLDRLGKDLTPLTKSIDMVLNNNKNIVFTTKSKVYEFNPYSRTIVDSFIQDSGQNLVDLVKVIADADDNGIWTLRFDYRKRWQAALLYEKENHRLEEVLNFDVSGIPHFIEYDKKIFLTGDGKILALDKQTREAKTYNLYDDDRKINLGNFSIDNENSLWIKSGNRTVTESAAFFKYNPALDSFLIQDIDIGSPFAVLPFMAFDVNNDMWLGGYSGDIRRINIETNEVVIYNDLLKELFSKKFAIKDIWFDAENQPYFSTHLGVISMRMKETYDYELYFERESEYCSEKCRVQSLLGLDDVIYADMNQSLYELDKKSNTIQRLPIRLPNTINGKAPRVQIDVGSHKLTTFDEKIIWHDNIIDTKTWDLKDILTYGGDYRCVNFISSDSMLWLAPYHEDKKDRRVFRYDLRLEKLYETYTPDSFVQNETPVHFLESKFDDVVWLCYARGGIDEYTKAGEYVRTLPLKSNFAYCIYESEQGYLWIGHAHGLKKLNLKTSEWTSYTDGTVNRIGEQGPLHIFSIVPENDSIIWMSGANTMERFNIRSEQFVTPVLPDEIANRTYSWGKNYFDSIENKLYFSSSSGVVSFDPNDYQQMNPAESKFPLLVTELVTHTKLDSSSQYRYSNLGNLTSITLPHHHFWFSLRYVLPQMKLADQIYYSHKLDGFDEKFIHNRKHNTLRYTNLPHGEYDLILRAGLREQVLDEYTKTIRIVVLQAWYKKWWAMLMWMLMGVGLVWYLVRSKFIQEIRKQKAIDELRTKISMDLHDDVGSILSGLSMQTELLANKVNDDLKGRMEKVNVLSRTAMMQLRDTVWAMDHRKNNWTSLSNRIREFAHMAFEDREVQFVFNHSDQLKGELNPVHRQNMYLIIKEAITNIIKHSDATIVNVNIKKDEANVSLSIADNGSVNKQAASSGQGLSNMRTRASQINGKLNISVNQGYKIHLILPML